MPEQRREVGRRAGDADLLRVLVPSDRLDVLRHRVLVDGDVARSMLEARTRPWSRGSHRAGRASTTRVPAGCRGPLGRGRRGVQALEPQQLGGEEAEDEQDRDEHHPHAASGLRSRAGRTGLRPAGRGGSGGPALRRARATADARRPCAAAPWASGLWRARLETRRAVSWAPFGCGGRPPDQALAALPSRGGPARRGLAPDGAGPLGRAGLARAGASGLGHGDSSGWCGVVRVATASGWRAGPAWLRGRCPVWCPASWTASHRCGPAQRVTRWSWSCSWWSWSGR